MAEIKLTKNELRAQQIRLGQLERYLPTLQLKKAQLQQEVSFARMEIEKVNQELMQKYESIKHFAALLTDQFSIEIDKVAVIDRLDTTTENIAGVEVPIFEKAHFIPFEYDLFDSPPWIDPAVESIRELISHKAAHGVAKEKSKRLEEELRQVSIRVNLFEKILIPRANKNIKTIKVFLGDQELAAVSQAKVAKAKIEARKSE
ncbi:MAG: V-type ATP synthase subunit D [Waddliaceae bacterium]